MDLEPIPLYIDSSNRPVDATLHARDIFLILDIIPESKFYYPIFINSTVPHIIVPQIPKSIENNVIQGKCQLLLIHWCEGWQWIKYEEMISEIQSQYHLFTDDVFVCINCNVIKSPKYKSIFYNYWEQFGYSFNVIKERQHGNHFIFKDEPRPYKFICLNRICHSQRFAVVTALYPYKDQGLLSFGNKEYSPLTQFRKHSLVTFKERYPKYFDEFVSLNLDIDFSLKLLDGFDSPRQAGLDFPVCIDEFPEKFYKSYVHIVVETSVGNVFFSEKTYKPMKYFQPFIIIGALHSLKHLRSMGYKTFGNYIDERYDEEHNAQHRLELAIQASLDFINQKNLHEVMKEMYPIFEHNHNNFISRCRNLQDMLHSDISKLLNKQENNANQN